MKIGTMLRDISKSFVRKPVTEIYPFERKTAPQKLRGRLLWNKETCTGCGLCGMDCPSSAIEMVVLDKKEKRFVLKYHVDRCTFCAQCTFSCRQGCLELSNLEWELASLNTEAFTIISGDQDDIKRVLEGSYPSKN